MKGKTPSITQNTALVLKKPQHYHAEIFCYEKFGENGTDFWNSIRFEDMVGNDIELVKSHCLGLAGIDRQQVYVKNIKMCSDVQHLKGLDD